MHLKPAIPGRGCRSVSFPAGASRGNGECAKPSPSWAEMHSCSDLREEGNKIRAFEQQVSFFCGTCAGGSGEVGLSEFLVRAGGRNTGQKRITCKKACAYLKLTTAAVIIDCSSQTRERSDQTPKGALFLLLQSF